MRFALLSVLLAHAVCAADVLDYRVELTSPTKLFDGTFSWAHPKMGTVPPGAAGNTSGMPMVVMTMQRVDLSASDLFNPLEVMTTSDLGKTWTGPAPISGAGFEWRKVEGGRVMTVCDFTPMWHAASGKLLGTGHTVYFDGKLIPRARPRATAYSAYDPATGAWSPWEAMKMPDDPRFADASAGCTQRVDLPDGDILLPIYFGEIGKSAHAVTVVRCRFDGKTLSYVEHGTELHIDTDRGLAEPSLAKFGDRFYLTVRHDKNAYVAASADGLHFDVLKPWAFDDGGELGSYNTQAHWITHSGGLFLAYTRRGANNDNVFRHRAPLFMARVDPRKLQVIRATERELMPNRGARLGNFSVTNVSPDETWVSDAEWMQPKGCEKYGADGSVWVSKIHWSKPNQLAK